jgi:hypothetical protein
MIKNHYLKNIAYKGTSLWDKKLELFEATIYNMLPEDELIAEHQMYSIYELHLQEHPHQKLTRNFSDVMKSFRKLVRDGFIREIPGKAIAKIV